MTLSDLTALAFRETQRHAALAHQAARDGGVYDWLLGKHIPWEGGKPKPPSPETVGGDAAQDAKALPPVLGTLSGNREPGVSGEHAACARSHTHPFFGLEVAPRRARRLVVPTGAAGPGRDCCEN